MSRAAWDRLLAAARRVHDGHDGLREFCAFPDDLRRQDVVPLEIPARARMEGDTGLVSQRYGELVEAFVTAGRVARWRETYKGTSIGQDFLDRFGCYCLIGEGGAFGSDRMRAWVVYMPAGLWYPWHHHPGEEMYMVLAGEAEFRRAGCAPEILGEGGCVQHSRNQSHASMTHSRPMMAYVVWRNGFDVLPVLSD